MPEPDQSISSRHKTALQSERDAWGKLAQSEGGRDPVKRAADLQSWLAANRDLREVEAILTAVTVRNATESMRDSAAVLSRQHPLPNEEWIDTTAASAKRPVMTKPPAKGQRYLGRDGSNWRVLAVTQDLVESGFYLAQLERRGGPGNETFEVYSDDWKLFSVVYGLQPDVSGVVPEDT